MSRWSNEDLAELLARNPSLRVSESPLKRRIVSIERRIDAQPFDVAEGGNGVPEGVKTPPKQRKYRNQPTMVGSVRFDSKKEAARWAELQLLERAGKIKNLQRQVRLPLKVEGQLICTCVVDFEYFEPDGDLWDAVFEDVKSAPSKTLAYRIKKKLVKALLNIEILES